MLPGPPSQSNAEPEQASVDGTLSRFAGFVLVLPTRRRRSKEELKQAKAAEKASRRLVEDQLLRKGIASDEPEIADFVVGIRECFDEVILGRYRQVVLQTVQETLTDDHPDLFESIGKAIPGASSNITKWKYGTPISFDMLFLFFAGSGFPISAIRFPGVAGVLRRRSPAP